MAHDLVCQNPLCSKPFRSSNPNVKCCSRVCRQAALELLYNRIPLATRFLEKVRPCSHGDFCPYCCLIWTASTNPAGYGLLGVKQANKWVSRLAHTVAWEIINQRPVPEGMQINHHCDNPPCCSIWHIYVGTQGTNNREMYARGRGAIGERRSPLTTDQVLSMPVLYRAGYSLHDLGQKFDVDIKTISKILNGKTWKHLPVALSSDELHTLSLSHRRKPRGPYTKRREDK